MSQNKTTTRSLVGISGLVAALSFTSLAHAQLTAITTADSGTLRNLSSLTANGTTYTPASLIGITVNHYQHTETSAFNNHYQPTAAPAAGTRLNALTVDTALNTGFANIGVGTGLTTAFTGTTPGINVVFNSPVFNRPGVDVVLFEIDGADPFWVSLSNGGARFQVVSSAYSINNTNLASRNWDMSRTGGPPNGGANSLTEFQNNSFTAGTVFTQNIRGVGIDLTSLGVLNGASVNSLFFQATTGAVTGVDPSFIAGLPTVVPEAGSAALLFGGLATFVGAVLSRRTQRGVTR